ncbi:hypothetical protein [Paenibacillus sp. Marseille-Q4541]|uniref:hypothetical protein n=1 Tax=Paenibacillus sp. Marseille-Q4541 TaxID=2831522 RepID=UPI001BA748EC|nr:hypothetical protein [Paenibacillus sp. Marseille-Q4541]
MKKKRIIPFVLSISIGAAVLLSTFVTLQGSEYPEQSKEVFSPGDRVTLTDTNLVDVLHELSLNTPISKVKWSKNVLTLDLKVTGSSIVPSDIYIDMASIASFSMDRTSNVNQLMLRFLAEDEWIGSRHLLLSADIRRSEWSSEALKKLKEWKNAELPEELIQRFHMTETNLWREQFISPEKG